MGTSWAGIGIGLEKAEQEHEDTDGYTDPFPYPEGETGPLSGENKQAFQDQGRFQPDHSAEPSIRFGYCCGTVATLHVDPPFLSYSLWNGILPFLNASKSGLGFSFTNLSGMINISSMERRNQKDQHAFRPLRP